MKPTKNYYPCGQCNRRKIRFGTQSEAQRFIDYNSEEIREKNGYAPTRTYYCSECHCWHLTSKEYAYYTRKNTHKIRHYDLEMDKAARAANRLLVKELREMLHKVNRYVNGHDGGAHYTRAYYTLLMQKAMAMYEQTSDSLTKRQREKISHRIYEIKAAESDSQLAKRGRLRRKTHTLRSHRHETGGLWRQNI